MNKKQLAELAELRRVVRQLACCDWKGKDALTQSLIVHARKLSGWKKADLQK